MFTVQTSLEIITDMDPYNSGKSSVLEGLTGIAFPRNSGLCTRFATQIVFRRSSTANVRISIIPAADAGVEHAEKMRAWKNRDQHSLRQKNFGKILAEVSTCNSVS